jgi:transcriptional regulator with XRE-family HTH domain
MDMRNAPIPVIRTLRKLGADIRAARLRRRIPMVIIAERAQISRATLEKIENGDAGASIGAYAKVLFALGLADHLGEIASLQNDPVGQRLELQALPKRIRPLGRTAKKRSDE